MQARRAASRDFDEIAEILARGWLRVLASRMCGDQARQPEEQNQLEVSREQSPDGERETAR